MKVKDIPMLVLAGTIVVGFFTLLYLLVYQSIPAENKDILNIVVGALIASFTAVVGYYFGSSKGSSDKNDILHQQKSQQP